MSLNTMSIHLFNTSRGGIGLPLGTGNSASVQPGQWAFHICCFSKAHFHFPWLADGCSSNVLCDKPKETSHSECRKADVHRARYHSQQPQTWGDILEAGERWSTFLRLLRATLFSRQRAPLPGDCFFCFSLLATGMAPVFTLTPFSTGCY